MAMQLLGETEISGLVVFFGQWTLISVRCWDYSFLRLVIDNVDGMAKEDRRVEDE